MLNTAELTKICADYGITATDLRIAGTVELSMAGKINDKTGDVAQVAAEFCGLLGDTGMMNAIRWATWIKHARETQDQALTYPDVLKIRKEEAGV